MQFRFAAAVVIGLFLCSGTAWGQGAWNPADYLTGARHSHSATLMPNGKVLVAGGWSTKSLRTCEVFDPATGTWAATENLGSSRFAHTATLMPSGKVIVVGGHDVDDATSLKDVELYDPRLETWSRPERLRIAREKHSATLLPSGKLLIVGGWDQSSGSYHRSTEIYDPIADSWSFAAPMENGRQRHTATLLPSGQVLVVGGEDETGALSSVELYDPDADLWTNVGPMSSPRFRHSATLLPSGQVLIVAGGIYAGSSVVALATSELFEPSTGTWTPTSELATGRYRHSATLLPSGQVLVTGGESDGVPNVGNPISSVEIYDPGSGSWTSVGDLMIGRFRHTATLLPTGQVLVIGGRAADGTVTAFSQCEVYSQAGTLTVTGALLYARERHSAVLLSSGKVLISGGCTRDEGDCIYPAATEIFDLETGSFQVSGSLSVPSEEHTATLLLSGKVLLAGGFNGATLSRAEIYDPVTGTWEITGSMSTPRQRHTATLLSTGEVLVAGGFNGTYLNGAEIFDPSTGTWRNVADLHFRRHRHQANLLYTGKVLVSGGRIAESALDTGELFDPKTGTWELTGNLQTPRHSHTATLLPSGKVLVAGGENGANISSSELYDPTTNSWQATGSLNAPRQYHRAMLLGSGKVLVSGGRSDDDTTSTIEIYDPTLGTWSLASPLSAPRAWHSSTLLQNGEVLIAAGSNLTSAELYREPDSGAGEYPSIAAVSPLHFGVPFRVAGQFRAGSEASSGNYQGSPTNFPVFRLDSADGRTQHWLVPEPRPDFWTDPTIYSFKDLPSSLEIGRYFLRSFVNGRQSDPIPVEVECSIAITQGPVDQIVAIGGVATFSVTAQGARRYQWRQDGVDIPGATAATYSTPPVSAADAGTLYSVEVDSLCTSALSNDAKLVIDDSIEPVVQVISPRGGEFWPLSASAPSQELITWEVSDNIRVCRVEVALLYSIDGGLSWADASPGGGLPITFDSGDACAFPGVQATSTLYEVPANPPSGAIGSLYKIRVRATDQAGLTTENASEQPFFIVQPNPDSVKTLILHHPARLPPSSDLAAGLRILANHPRVEGLLVDLSQASSLDAAYAAWDTDISDQGKANDVVMALRQYLRTEILPVYAGVESIVIVGDDRVVPMARIQDYTALPESFYTHADTGSLTPNSTVGQALSQNFYLSDDPLAVRGALTLPLRPEDFANGAFLPDLAVGRLVETPTEIVRTIATFLSQDGILDLGNLSDTGGHKVLVTGYDFLEDSAKRVRAGWQNALGVSLDPAAATPVNGRLIENLWGVSTVPERRSLLFQGLGGEDGESYAINNLNGHGTHYEEGVPSTFSSLIEGLESSTLYGSSECAGTGLGADLAGSIVYAIGCHGGLPVPGSCSSDVDHSLDLPQAMMARGAVVYIANSGYGWGLESAVGLSERLIELFSEELRVGGSRKVGDVFLRSKLRYFLEQPGFNVYDEKTLLQWTYFGLPMYAVKTGITSGRGSAKVPWFRAAKEGESALEDLGSVQVEKRVADGDSLPDFMVSVQLRFRISDVGVYQKFDADGNELSEAGCSSPDGCYYTLNGIASGTPDLPIEPYFVFDSRWPGTSQHGALWLGGEYEEEDWIPVMAELATNGGSYSDHGSLPRLVHRLPFPQRIETEGGAANCTPSDTEINSMAVVTGEALKAAAGDLEYNRHRLYRELDFENLYFNDRGLTGGNCDRRGPLMAPAESSEYHSLQGSRIDWAVSASDEAGVWRVVVVYDLGIDASGRGRWIPVELVEDQTAPGVWRASVVPPPGVSQLAYLVQAVDRRGNVGWVAFEPTQPPDSLLRPDLPKVLDVGLAGAEADLTIDLSDSPNPVALGGLLGYTVVVTNRGPSVANEVTITDVLPPSLTFAGYGGNGWVCGFSAGMLTCDLETLPIGSGAILSIFAYPGEVGPMVNVVFVSALEFDPQLEDNSAEVITEVSGTADLAVSLTLDQAVAIPGQLVNFMITASNLGPQGAQGAAVIAALTPGLIGVNWTCTPSLGATCDPDGSGSLAGRSNISSGSHVTFDVRGYLSSEAAGLLEVGVRVVSPVLVLDPQPGNNEVSAVVPVFPALHIFGDGFESGDLRAWQGTW